jgi:hypothetical protein
MFGIVKNLNTSSNQTDLNNVTINRPLNMSEELSYLEELSIPWNQNLDWTNPSWSKVLLSDSESFRSDSTVNRQKESPMVLLVKRLELFPSKEIILNISNLFDKELQKLYSVRNAMGERDKEEDQNPILTQTEIEVKSEITKIQIEAEALQKKLEAEKSIIADLIDIGIKIGFEFSKLKILLELYGFEINEENKVSHPLLPLNIKFNF